MRSPLVCAIAVCLAGCAVGPDYRQPSPAVTAQFTNGTAASFTAEEAQK